MYVQQLVCVREFVIFHRPFAEGLALANTQMSVSRQANDPVNTTIKMEITVTCFMEKEKLIKCSFGKSLGHINHCFVRSERDLFIFIVLADLFMLG